MKKPSEKIQAVRWMGPRQWSRVHYRVPDSIQTLCGVMVSLDIYGSIGTRSVNADCKACIRAAQAMRKREAE